MSSQIILVVEDNPTEQYVLEQLLKKFDYESQVVPSGEEAIVAVGITEFAAILMDMTLPGIDGCECTRRIRRIELESGRRVPIIAITARAGQKDQEMCLASGMDDYLSKPFDPEQLRKVLLRYVYDENQPNLKTLQPVRPGDIEIPWTPVKVED